MRRIAALLAVALVGAGLLLPASTALATFPARNGLIAYSAATDDGMQLFTVRANGRDRRQITHVEGDVIAPDWSPDGRRIAFELDVDDGCSVAIVDADGSGLVVLPPGEGGCDAAPDFAPDGSHLIFQALNPDTGNDGIWSMRTDGSGRRFLGNGPGLATQPSVSPDGRSIALVGWNLLDDVGHVEGLYTMAADGSGTRLVSPNWLIFPKHDWSPDGSRLVFSAPFDDPTVAVNVYSVRSDGSDLRQLTHFVDPADSAVVGSYSPDGEWIVFRVGHGDQFALYRMRPDGSEWHKLASLSASQRPRLPDWGPAARP